MLQSIRVTPGEAHAAARKARPGLPLICCASSAARRWTSRSRSRRYRPALPGRPPTGPSPASQGQSGWVERPLRRRSPGAGPGAARSQTNFVKECIRAEIDSNAGGDDDGFPVDADYLIAWALIASDIANLPPDRPMTAPTDRSR